MQLVFACFLCSSCLRGLRGGRTPYPWIGGCVFTGGKNERDPRPHKLLLPWCHTLQVKPVQHSSMRSILEKHFLSALLFFRVYIQLHKQCKLKMDTCWVDKTLCCFFFFYLLSLFSSSVTLDNICQRAADTEQPTTRTLRKIVNRLRRYFIHTFNSLSST